MGLAIKVENLSKAYQIGQFNTGALAHDLERWWALFRGKEDPFLKIGEANDRSVKGASNIVWSLKDINLEIEQGDTVGIIGKNGAGKSTLLKVLSRVTSPTTGNVKVKGRIASLLEVGTGFHPELTGKENIFLNGAILGMRKREIKRRFDEIVEFAGIERYIDTPVKRYSSGMYVRLAFAVAAHLESEILIVDEVLAVGDAEFQKKCIGKMGDISTGEGRTILFVSHNMASVESLCKKAIFMENGLIVNQDLTSKMIRQYINNTPNYVVKRVWESPGGPGDEVVRLREARLIDIHSNDAQSLDFYSGGGIEFHFEVLENGFKPVPNIHVFDERGAYVFVSSESTPQESYEIGIYKTQMWLPANLMNDATYVVGLAVTTYPGQVIHFFEKEALTFKIVEDVSLRDNDYRGETPGIVRPKLKWHTEKTDVK